MANKILELSTDTLFGLLSFVEESVSALFFLSPFLNFF